MYILFLFLHRLEFTDVIMLQYLVITIILTKITEDAVT